MFLAYYDFMYKINYSILDTQYLLKPTSYFFLFLYVIILIKTNYLTFESKSIFINKSHFTALKNLKVAYNNSHQKTQKFYFKIE